VTWLNQSEQYENLKPTVQQNNTQFVSGDYFSDWSPQLRFMAATTCLPAAGDWHGGTRLQVRLATHTRQWLLGGVGLHVEGIGLTLYLDNF
jgi:hypothetical protein